MSGQEHIVDGGMLAAGPRVQGRFHNSRNLHRTGGHNIRFDWVKQASSRRL